MVAEERSEWGLQASPSDWAHSPEQAEWEQEAVSEQASAVATPALVRKLRAESEKPWELKRCQ